MTQQYPYPGQPHPNWNPPPGQGYPNPYPHQYPARPAAPGPVFQVRPIKLTGKLIAWYNRRVTVTGTLAECEAAIKSAQVHNLVAGWWSLGSVILWNWIAIVTTARERKRLHQSAAQTEAAARHWTGT